MIRCEQCKAWCFTKDFSGFCKRHAPKPTVLEKRDGAEYLLVWPSTLKDDGCEDGIPRNTGETGESKKS